MLLSSLDIGCAISASDGSSPQVYVRLLAVDHRLECNFPRGFSNPLVESMSVECCLVVERIDLAMLRGAS